MMPTMNILLVDDHEATREEMTSLLSEYEDLDVVGQAGDGEEGVRQARELTPDLIVMDVVMPRMNGIEATKAIHAFLPEVPVLVLSNHTGGNFVEIMLHAGASGYVRKDLAYEELVPAIRALEHGEPYIGNGVRG